MSSEKLSILLKGFDLPCYRKSNFNKNNLLWLSKNISKRNKDQPRLDEAIKKIKDKLDNADYDC